MDVTFREKVTPKEKAPTPKPNPQVDTQVNYDNLPPTLYRETTGKPYLSKVLEIEGVIDDIDLETRETLDLIDEYFGQKVKKGEYKNDAVAYREFWKHLENVVDVTNSPTLVKIKKIADFIKALQRYVNNKKSS